MVENLPPLFVLRKGENFRLQSCNPPIALCGRNKFLEPARLVPGIVVHENQIFRPGCSGAGIAAARIAPVCRKGEQANTGKPGDKLLQLRLAAPVIDHQDAQRPVTGF